MLNIYLEIANVEGIFVSLDNPCKPNCPERSQTCHSTCPDYIKFRKSLDERNKKIRNAKSMCDMLDEYVVRDIRKNKKRKR